MPPLLACLQMAAVTSGWHEFFIRAKEATCCWVLRKVAARDDWVRLGRWAETCVTCKKLKSTCARRLFYGALRSRQGLQHRVGPEQRQP